MKHWCPSKLCPMCKRHDECYPPGRVHTGIVMNCDRYLAAEKTVKG